MVHIRFAVQTLMDLWQHTSPPQYMVGLFATGAIIVLVFLIYGRRNSKGHQKK